MLWSDLVLVVLTMWKSKIRVCLFHATLPRSRQRFTTIVKKAKVVLFGIGRPFVNISTVFSHAFHPSLDLQNARPNRTDSIHDIKNLVEWLSDRDGRP